MQGGILSCSFRDFLKIQLVIGLLFFGSCSFADPIDSDEIKSLEDGMVLQKDIQGTSLNSSKSINGSESKILIKAPPEKVWKVLDEKENLPTIVRQITEAKIIEDDGNIQKVRASVKLCRLLPTFNYIFCFDKSEKYRKMKFKKTDGCFKELFGHFEFIPHGDSTILGYKIYSNSGFYIPSFIANGLKSDVEDIMKTIKKEAEKNKTLEKTNIKPSGF